VVYLIHAGLPKDIVGERVCMRDEVVKNHRKRAHDGLERRRGEPSQEVGSWFGESLRMVRFFLKGGESDWVRKGVREAGHKLGKLAVEILK